MLQFFLFRAISFAISNKRTFTYSKMTTQKKKTYALISDETLSKQAIGMYELFVDETIQGDRVSKSILNRLSTNDTLVVVNIQYLGTSLSEIIETLKEVAEHSVNLCLVGENLSFKAKKLPEIASSLLIAWKLHQSLISLRSKTTLQERKAQGKYLGRPYGSNPKLKLDDYREDISQMRLSGVSIKKISEKYHVCPATIYNLMHKYPELFVIGGM